MRCDDDVMLRLSKPLKLNNKTKPAVTDVTPDSAAAGPFLSENLFQKPKTVLQFVLREAGHVFVVKQTVFN